MLKKVLGTLLRDAGLTWLLSLPMRGRCGWASLSPAPAYNLQPSDEGIGLSAWHRLVPSCSNGLWCFTGGYTNPGLGYLRRCLTSWVPVS
jgi:hypothetical protein